MSFDGKPSIPKNDYYKKIDAKLSKMEEGRRDHAIATPRKLRHSLAKGARGEI